MACSADLLKRGGVIILDREKLEAKGGEGRCNLNQRPIVGTNLAGLSVWYCEGNQAPAGV